MKKISIGFHLFFILVFVASFPLISFAQGAPNLKEFPPTDLDKFRG